MFAEGKISISLIDLYKKISDFDIIRFYFGVKSIPETIISPIRQDKLPSMGFYSVDGKKIMYHDFGTSDSGGIIDLMMKYFKLGFNDTLIKLYLEVSKNNTAIINNKTCNICNKVTHIHKSKLDCKIRAWKSWDLEFWESFGISLEWLKFGNIYPISRIIIQSQKGLFDIPADKYAYAYIEFKDNKESLKIYQPFSKTRKWTNKHDSSVWDLWSKLPEYGDMLIITSSRKDALCIWANTNIPSCSLQAESYLPKKQVINQLKERFQNIFVLYDNDYTKPDNYGQIFGNNFANKFNLINIFIPSELESKDSSDLYKNKGKETLIFTINNLIKNKK